MNWRRFNERGEGGLKAIIAIVILGAVAYVCIQLIPIYWDHWNLKDKLTTKVTYAFTPEVGYRSDHQQRLQADVIGLLNNIGAEYDKDKDVKVTVDPSSKKIQVEIQYGRTVKIPFMANPKIFNIYIENTTLE